jgi:hypothetical protein
MTVFGEPVTTGFEGGTMQTVEQEVGPHVYKITMENEVRTLTLSETRDRFVMTAVDLTSMIWVVFDGPCRETR